MDIEDFIKVYADRRKPLMTPVLKFESTPLCANNNFATVYRAILTVSTETAIADSLEARISQRDLEGQVRKDLLKKLHMALYSDCIVTIQELRYALHDYDYQEAEKLLSELYGKVIG